MAALLGARIAIRSMTTQDHLLAGSHLDNGIILKQKMNLVVIFQLDFVPRTIEVQMSQDMTLILTGLILERIVVLYTPLQTQLLLMG